MNTSFNLNGQPIVLSPSDAIKTFYSCGLDILVIGNYKLLKDRYEIFNKTYMFNIIIWFFVFC